MVLAAGPMEPRQFPTREGDWCGLSKFAHTLRESCPCAIAFWWSTGEAYVAGQRVVNNSVLAVFTTLAYSGERDWFWWRTSSTVYADLAKSCSLQLSEFDHTYLTPLIWGRVCPPSVIVTPKSSTVSRD